MKGSQGHCFTVKYNNRSNVLKSSASILSLSAPSTLKADTTDAVWDTGAMSTCISTDFAKKINLSPVSIEKITTPSGAGTCPVYYVTLVLPNSVQITKIPVLGIVPGNCDVLIGMDVISLGDLAVTTYNNETCFSFRIPSMQTIDFTKHSYFQPIKSNNKIGRNDLCPCGSGLKYKQCHGKTT
jgi:hypothetical protein